MAGSLGKKSPKSALRVRRQKPISRRVVFLVIGLVLIGVLATIGYHQYEWSKSTRQAQVDYEAATEQVKAKLTSEDVDVESIDKISKAAANAADGLCRGVFLGDVRTQWLESARKHQKQCQDDAKKLQRVSAAATDVKSWLDAERELIVVYKEAQDGLAEVDTDDFSEQQKLWREVKSKIESTELGDRLYSNRKEAQVKAVDEIVSSYSTLIKADRDKKRPDFDTSLKKLQKAYDGLSEATESIEEGYRKYVEALAMAIESL